MSIQYLAIGRKNGKTKTTQKLIMKEFKVCTQCKKEEYCKDNYGMIELCIEASLAYFIPKENE
ncbi:MAG TPA: hypothetical protein K8V90_01515 [Romboutsia timonensis]|uniref:Uncharacterized protein n=1 Tax=Romboutsia timonensis TaxID=1776391 RepID=A0A921MYS1_9FIRM|nr:hypothetical protein [Romboutsia timonensis]